MKSLSHRTVIFEGNEATGKSTLMKEFQLLTNFRYPCLDRWLLSAIVYNQAKERNLDQYEELLGTLSEAIDQFDMLVVHLYVAPDIRLNRFRARGDWYIEESELARIQQVYYSEVERLTIRWPNNVLSLRNHDEDKHRNLEIIKNHVEKLIQRQGG